MPEHFEWIREFLINYPYLQYAVIFLATGFGGELGLFALAFLAANNAIPWTALFIFSALGTFSTDSMWFLLGGTKPVQKMLSHKYASPTVEIVTEALQKVSRRNNQAALILVKFLIGTRIVMFLLVSRMYPSYWKFAEHNAAAVLVWVLVMIPVGYFAGIGYSYLSTALNNIYVGLGFILLMVLGIFAAQIYIKKRLIKKAETVLE